MAYHPHGVLGFGATTSFATGHVGANKLFPGIYFRLLTLKVNFYLPGFREYLLINGVACVSKKGIGAVLHQKGTAGVIVPGGAQESLYVGDEEKVQLYLRNRKGFVKMALIHGSDLVPVFGFGENNIFKQAPNPEGSKVRAFQNWMKKYITFTIPLFFGRGVLQYTYGLMPFRRPINVVVGAPIHVEQTSTPTQEDIDGLHAKYVTALEELYATYNPKYGDPKVKLVIV